MEWVRIERGMWEMIFGDEIIVDEPQAFLSEGFGHTYELTIIVDGEPLCKRYGIRTQDRATGIVEWELSREGCLV